MRLIVVEDRQADAALRRALATVRAHGEPFVVLTADALLAMRLRRDGVDARLPLDAFVAGDAEAARARVEQADRVALDGAARALGAYANFGGTDFAPYLEYTLIPSFVRAVRNVTAVRDIAAQAAATRLLLVGGGALVQAAQLVAGRLGIPSERVAGNVLTRTLQAIARLRAGRATRWVNTEFRALVLEPGFLALLFARGLWRRITGPAPPAVQPDAIIVAGDRFTADVVEALRGRSAQTILAGATQPGRALFDPEPSLVQIETFSTWSDVLRTTGIAIDGVARAASLAADRAHGQSFAVGDVCYWPLVRRTAVLHVVMWAHRLQYLEALTLRAARAAPRGRVLTANDVTAYNRVLIDAARRCGLASVGIQHGMTAEPNGHTMVHVDTLAIWGEQAEEWYRFEAARLGRQQTARFVVTGNPRYDGLAARVGKADDPRAPFTVCVCTGFLTDFSTSASEYHNLAMIDAVLAWAKDHPGVRVIHKIHPGEELEYYAAAGRALGWDPLTLTTIADPILHDVLQRSQVLVSEYSSTVLESIALGTPAVIFDAITRRRMVHTPQHPLARVPGVSVGDTPAGFAALLDGLLTGPRPDPDSLRCSAELRAFLSTLDGGAAARVAALLRD